MAAKLLLLLAAGYAMARLGKRLTGRNREAAAGSGAAWPTIDDESLETCFRLKKPDEAADATAGTVEVRRLLCHLLTQCAP